MKKYDYLIVGAGLYGSVFAREMTNRGKKCLVVERRGHIGGNCYTENIDGIDVHKYGAHIFHTSDREVWEYVNKYCNMQPYIHSPVARYGEKLYPLPFNMNTFYALWGVKTPEQAKEKIRVQVPNGIGKPQNLEEQALKLVGRDIYETLVKGYTEKQWGRPCKELPSFIIQRLPLRFTFDNNYFNDPYQGIPEGGYTRLFENLLYGIDLKLNTDFIKERKKLEFVADRIVYTGQLDEFFGYSNGELEYRSLRFENEFFEKENFQGCSVMNYTSRDVLYTRCIEHKHFDRCCQVKGTIVTYEYPETWQRGKEAFYPINNATNEVRAKIYQNMAKEQGILFGGRLADYKYYDMGVVVRHALDDLQHLN